MISIRSATRDDIVPIMNIEALSLKHPWVEEDIASLMDEPSSVSGKIAVVAQENSDVIAYVGASYVLDECEIGNVCTHPDYRRRGAARAVLEELFLRCQKLGIQQIFLEVSSTNIAAIELYKVLGFEQYNTRSNYYGAGDDALLFVYKL